MGARIIWVDALRATLFAQPLKAGHYKTKPPSLATLISSCGQHADTGAAEDMSAKRFLQEILTA